MGGVFVEWRVNNGSRDLGMVYGKSFFSPQTTEKTFLVGITDDEVSSSYVFFINPINHWLYENLFTIWPPARKSLEHVSWGCNMVGHLREV